MLLVRSMLLAGLSAAALGAAEGEVFKPNVRYSTFDFPGLEVHAPTAEAARLAPFAARAAAIYARMQADAGWAPTRTLHLVLSDDEDGHNGFSTVIPFPLINVQLGPTRPESGLFAGDDETTRTLVHELAHHLANDRNHGWRAWLETVFGRVLPNEPLSLGIFLLSTPNHVLSPAFWHEGLAQWSETIYADPGQAWGGRGRDSLTHMAWRLDVAAGGVAPEDTWRLDYQVWPYGNRAYLYGLAYTRWLSGAFGDRRGLWRLVDSQGRLNMPFAFVAGSRGALGFAHDELIPQARADLQTEQEHALAVIRTQAVTAVPRATALQTRVAAPAWSTGGSLVYAADAPTDTPALETVGVLSKTGPRRLSPATWSMGNVRRVAEGLVVQSEAPVGSDRWQYSRVRLIHDGRIVHELPQERLIMPDAREQGAGYEVAAVRLDGAGEQSLVLVDVQGAERVVPTAGRPWSPAFRPGQDALCWVETDRDGSRLILAALDGLQRQVLWQVRGRILHPVWDAAGGRIFCASDISGVANGWCVTPGGEARPVTNTIGGVLAVVPSPDGRHLAVLDHDADGPFIGIMDLDPATWPDQLPTVVLPWPAPVVRRALGAEATGVDQPDPTGPVPADGGAPAAARPYSGLRELRPRFWTPTTAVVPEGGLGVVAVAADALMTHTVIASAGLGYHERSPVGLVAWTYSGWNPGLGFIAKRSELDYDQQVLAADGNFYDYTETVDTLEGRVGYGLGGFERRWQGWLAAGVDRHAAVDSATDDYAGLDTADPQPFVGDERYLELTIAYDDSILYPTSYDREDGTSLALRARTSDQRGSSVLGMASYSLPVWAEGGHQLVGAMQMGWSDGPHDLQARFGIGGNRAEGLPRGYPTVIERGRCLEAYSLAYRLPVWRPFDGAGTSPWVTRQVVLEGFYDAASVTDSLQDKHRWYRSAGAELHLDFSYWLVRFAPGVGVARQIDGLEDTAGYLSLGFNW
jgi:hypothetical protein